MTRLDDNRARSLIAGKLCLSVDSVKNTIIWGNHSNTQYPDLEHTVAGDLKGNEIIETIGKEYLDQYIHVLTSLF